MWLNNRYYSFGKLPLNSNGYYKNESFNWNPSFWLGETYYQITLKMIADKKIIEAKEYLIKSLYHLKPWKRKIDNDDWNNYLNSVLKSIQFQLNQL